MHLDPTTVTRFWKHVTFTSTCWLWNGAHNTHGYGLLWHRNGKRKWATLVHRIAWELHNGPIPEGFCVCHHCDTPNCINPSHLFVGTLTDNIRDMDRKGRRAIEGRHPRAKLTPEDVRAIRKVYVPGICTYRQLALQYDVHHTIILDIVKHRIWRRVL